MKTTNNFIIFNKGVAEKIEKRKKCSIILLNSIYGLVGQDKSIYKGQRLRKYILPTTKGVYQI